MNARTVLFTVYCVHSSYCEHPNTRAALVKLSTGTQRDNGIHVVGVLYG
jgi:hypothetical protein